MQFRFAGPADVANLARMNQHLVQDTAHRNRRLSLAQLESRMAGLLADGHRAVLFEDDAGVGGYALYRIESEWVYVRQFFVERAHRRAGTGREAFRWLKANPWKDHPRIRLDVLAGNAPAMAFWRSVGFADYGVTLEFETPP